MISRWRILMRGIIAASVAAVLFAHAEDAGSLSRDAAHVRPAGQHDDPLVVAMDFLFGGACKYCCIARSLVFGIGLPLLWHAPLAGAGLIALSFGATLVERYWLCELPENTD